MVLLPLWQNSNYDDSGNEITNNGETLPTHRRPHRGCCCDRCNHYAMDGCVDPWTCCGCIPKKLCLNLKYSEANVGSVCEQDLVSFELPWDCINRVWTDANGTYEAWIQSTGKHSLDFDGSADYLTRATQIIGATGEFWLVLFIKTTASSGTIYCETATEEGTPADEFSRIRVRLSSGSVQANWQNTSGQGCTATSTGTVNDGNWHCVAVHFEHDGSYNATVYIDGSSDGTDTQGPYTLNSDSDVAYIGCDWNHAGDARSDYLDGQLFLMSVYDSTFVAGDLTNYCACTDITDGIIARWAMNDGTNTSAMPDNFGGFDLTMNSFTSGSWLLDVPSNCDDIECYVYLQSNCLNAGYPLIVGMANPLGDPTDANGPECRTINYTWEDVAVDADCRPGNTCTTADVQIKGAEYIKLPYRNDDCDYFCGTCSCVCKTLCVTLTVEGVDAGFPISGSVCMENPVCTTSPTVYWRGAVQATGVLQPGGVVTFGDDITITLFPNATTGACEATIVGTTIGSSGTLTLVGCPGLDVEHQFTVGDETWTIRARCSECCTCAGPDIEVGCCENPLPETLTFTLTDAGNCSCYDGLTGTATWSDAESGWRGVINSEAACGLDDGTQVATIEVILRCVSADEITYDWEIEVNTTCSGGGTGNTWVPDEPSLSCDPLYVRTEDILDVACCNTVTPLQGLFYVEFSE